MRWGYGRGSQEGAGDKAITTDKAECGQRDDADDDSHILTMMAL